MHELSYLIYISNRNNGGIIGSFTKNIYCRQKTRNIMNVSNKVLDEVILNIDILELYRLANSSHT